ncbi:PTS system D-fructose-specific IIA component (F1P-forming) (Frc family) /PTS system D-fructose-specific IIB component (F1P-forming) (Frc family) /PTS system D-fructose-specific IIC component (F1P-forming) (Frc family) [Curtobacterium sp. PhB130]|uniref:PTS fructose transporter subunit IIABC n=1 Tax=unclassified Curtobacterium TaxID=257496 RepID=UPI000F4C4B6A|nr:MULTISPECIES: fructose-specific PTS transporter subunit EIIC [unclassified Curtobacterium]ROS78310.1 PTS system D-fructose-specific IIA component (F1P-forming) (Frc family) /PTS system D-fructose-specific IIB component (F1P-forming) (Frc family) /PTS system D-fructose-specific IIC component (F1P-forming) (Frc family) [Curtobacterium sp. PhB130]TCK65373.1 PTS system D-fructose-specific IIA component (F1P-forming) (Frc family) /PTS system D-fructose-specific IIB component (F1P-forming) (Frc fami
MTAERTTSPGLISVPLVGLDEDLGATSADVIRVLADRVAASGRAASGETLAADAIKREASVGTGVPGGIAIPHARSASVTEPTLAMSRLARKVPFGAPDGDADLVFMIAVPEGADKDHLTVLSTLARALIRDDFTAALRAATTQQEIVDLVDREVTGEVADAGVTGAPRASTAVPGPADPAADGGRKVIVGVTACPTGIAHTYMAADALVAAAQRAGAEMHVETQGSSQVEPLDPALIARADAVVFAVDVDVRDRSRFAGKPLVSGPVKRGVDEPDAMIAEALRAADDPHAARVSGTVGDASSSTAKDEHFGQSLKRWLLTGVSYMIPFVAGGGLLIALGFLLAGYGIALPHGDSGQNNAVYTLTNYTLLHLPPQGLAYYLGAAAFQIGGVSLGFLVAALAGYIAYAMADRPGIAPGFVAGSIAVFMNAGFLGGLVGGLIAGAAAYWIGRIPVWRWLRGLMPVVIIPLFASIIASGLLLLVLGGPIAWVMTELTAWLNSLSGASAVLLGIILGLMMAFDLGGPVNKVAYAFAVAGLGAGTATNVVPFEIMAAVMAAGMVPPLALALASTLLYRKGFTKPERENGKAAWLLGASFISEGAIPFAAADPLRVIPASMVGAAVTGAISMAAGVTSRAPHGGIFVFFAIGDVGMFIVAILSGTVVSALVLVGLKKWVRRAPAADAARAEEAALAGDAVDQRTPVAA